MIEWKKRFSSKSFWVSILALVPLSLQAFGDISILPDNYSEIATIFLSLLAAMGIINDPTTKGKWFVDDKKDIK